MQTICTMLSSFPVDRWLDSGEGDKRISLDLEPNKKPGQLVAAGGCLAI